LNKKKRPGALSLDVPLDVVVFRFFLPHNFVRHRTIL